MRLHADCARLLEDAQGESFEGGRLELERKADARSGTAACAEAHAPRALDAVAWRGWEWHRVAPVTRGVRRVLVAEWWAPDCF